MSFIFINADDTSFTALDASELTGDDLAISGIFIGQTKEKSFRLGNTGSSSVKFDISASGLNASIIDDVEFSKDLGANWDTTISVSGIGPNEISDRIKVRYTPDDNEILGIGSFLIRVDES